MSLSASYQNDFPGISRCDNVESWHLESDYWDIARGCFYRMQSVLIGVSTQSRENVCFMHIVQKYGRSCQPTLVSHVIIIAACITDSVDVVIYM